MKKETLKTLLRDVRTSTLSGFQKEAIGVIDVSFENLLLEKISDNSSVEDSPFLDIILRLNDDPFVVNFSIRKDLLIVNSNYFDINIYPETHINQITLLINEVLLGNYQVVLGYNRKGDLVRKKVVFDCGELKEFNQSQKIGFFGKEIEREDKVRGIQLISRVP